MYLKANCYVGFEIKDKSCKVNKQIYRLSSSSIVKVVGLYDRMVQNYKCNEIKIKCSEFSHTIDATFLKIRSALSHAFIAKCFRSEISLDPIANAI